MSEDAIFDNMENADLQTRKQDININYSSTFPIISMTTHANKTQVSHYHGFHQSSLRNKPIYFSFLTSVKSV